MPHQLRADVVAYPVDSVIDYAGLTDHVRTLLPRESPFVLVAESFSGPIALRLASAPPHGLKGIVLVCTFAASPDLVRETVADRAGPLSAGQGR